MQARTETGSQVQEFCAMNYPQHKNNIVLDTVNGPVFFVDEMTEAGAEKNVFRNQGVSFRHSRQGKDFFLQFTDKGLGVARAVSDNIRKNIFKFILRMPG